MRGLANAFRAMPAKSGIGGGSRLACTVGGPGLQGVPNALSPVTAQAGVGRGRRLGGRGIRGRWCARARRAAEVVGPPGLVADRAAVGRTAPLGRGHSDVGP